MFRSISILVLAFLITIVQSVTAINQSNELSLLGLHVIPYPQEVVLGGQPFIIGDHLNIVIDQGLSQQDKITAEHLKKDLQNDFNITVNITGKKGPGSILLTHQNASSLTGDQSYKLTVNEDELIITAKAEAGLFYGTQTLLQIIQKGRKGLEIPGMEINDWPDISQRAAHYDTKHHQNTMSYVKSFIRDLARYKINMLVWEWEDKFDYPSHSEIGAPGAFTMKEIQSLTKYAKDYQVQIVPLVQGLGHVSFILKWSQHHHLREIDASNWEFCPLKDGAYDLMFELWDDAIKATPTSEYIHIGSDETFELGLCKECQAKKEEIGKSGLYLLFVNKATEYLQKAGRKVMVWERPMGWKMNSSPAVGITPAKGMVFTESYNYNTPDFKYVKEAKSLGYDTYAYDPNPGIEPLFLPYFYRLRNGKKAIGSLENSYNYLTSAAISKAFDGMINTSWDDSGLHNQMWMLSFITSAEYSWSGVQPGLEQFKESFFKNYYGSSVTNMSELFQLLNEGAYYFAHTFERNVWHHGDIGKTHLPDLPRGDAMEYDPYWNTEYKDMVARSREMLSKMGRALQIIENNKKIGVKNEYDFELFESIAALIRHTCLTYMNLSTLERTINQAHRNNFADRKLAYQGLEEAQKLIENSLKRRKEVFTDLVQTWEKTRLPKGYSTKNKEYFFMQDRARHFAMRTKDMSYLIYDEQLLDLEGYLEELKVYMAYYKTKILEPEQ